MEVCGRQGIALRGRRDDSKHLEDMDSNPGNFQALLKFRCDAASDAALAEHLSKCARNATYCSKTTQNEIIEVLGGMITETIIAEVSGVASPCTLVWLRCFQQGQNWRDG